MKSGTIESMTDSRFDLVPATSAYGLHGPVIGEREFIPVSGMSMYGLLLWELAPEHVARFALADIPEPTPGWYDTEGDVTILPGYGVDEDILAAVHESLVADLQACGLPELDRDYLWCVEALKAGTYAALFSEELDRRRGNAPTPRSDHVLIHRIAQELNFQ